MKNKSKIKLFLIAFLMMFTGYYDSGCATFEKAADFIQEEPIVAKSAIQYGTLKYIDEDAMKSDMVTTYAESIENIIESGEFATLDLIIEKIRDDIIESDSIDQADKIVAINLVDGIERYAKKRLEESGRQLNEYEVTAKTVLSWVKEAAELSQMGVSSEAYYINE